MNSPIIYPKIVNELFRLALHHLNFLSEEMDINAVVSSAQLIVKRKWCAAGNQKKH